MTLHGPKRHSIDKEQNAAIASLRAGRHEFEQEIKDACLKLGAPTSFCNELALNGNLKSHQIDITLSVLQSAAQEILLRIKAVPRETPRV